MGIPYFRSIANFYNFFNHLLIFTMRLKIPYLLLALFPIVTSAASIPTQNGNEIEETIKSESMPIVKGKPNANNAKSTNVSTSVTNPLEAKKDTVNATDKDASLKNVDRFNRMKRMKIREDSNCSDGPFGESFKCKAKGVKRVLRQTFYEWLQENVGVKTVA